MRAPLVCRQCLSRLTGHSSKSNRISHARIHTEAGKEHEQDLSVRLQWPAVPVQSVPGAEQQVSGSSHDSEQDEANSAKDTSSTREFAFIKYRAGLKNHVGRPRGQNPSSILKTRILDAKGWLKYLQPHVMEFYGLNHAGGAQIIQQLKRIFYGRSTQVAAQLLDEYHSWKTVYVLFLRKLKTVDLKMEPWPESFKISEWFDFAENEIPSVASMRAAWQGLDPVVRGKLWPRVVMAALGSSPKVFSTIVQATFDANTSPAYVLEDVIRLLVARVEPLEESEKEEAVKLVIHVLQTNPNGILRLEQDAIGRLVDVATVDQAVEIFRTLVLKDHELSSFTLLHFADRFARSNEHKLPSAEIMCSLAEKGFDINSPEGASVCTTLLNLDKTGPLPQGRTAPDELFKMLLNHGFQPNLINMTALMRNFCIRGHLQAACTIFDLLVENGMEPNEYSYSVLLTGARDSLNFTVIRGIMSKLQSTKTWNAHILNGFLNLLHDDNKAMFQPDENGRHGLGRRQQKVNSAFRVMLQVYAKYFRLDPLQKFLVQPLENQLSLAFSGAPSEHKYGTQLTELAAAMIPLPDESLLGPDTISLTLMISAKVQTFNNPRAVLYTYHRFLDLFRSRDDLALGIVEKHGSLIFDIFLRAMLQFKETLPAAVQIVRSLIEHASREQDKTDQHVRYPSPSVYTWTIMVNGFKNHRMPEDAVSMIKMMSGSGLQPNLATWNALITAFARVGNARGAVRAMRYLKENGFQPDERTSRAFRWLRGNNRDLAVRLLRAQEARVAEVEKTQLQDGVEMQSEEAPRDQEPYRAYNILAESDASRVATQIENAHLDEPSPERITHDARCGTQRRRKGSHS